MLNFIAIFVLKPNFYGNDFKMNEQTKRGDLEFRVGDEEPAILRITANGDFFVKGRFVENDLEVFKAFKDWMERAAIEV